MNDTPTALSATRRDSVRVWLARTCLRAMVTEADRHAPDETGGLLVGYRCGNAYVVEQVTTAGPRAQHFPEAYVPDYDYDTGAMARLYDRSFRRAEYLGDWHTHPTATAYLSDQDTRVIRRIATSRAARASQPLMMILGRGPDWEIAAWCGEMVGRLPCRRRLFVNAVELAFFDDATPR